MLTRHTRTVAVWLRVRLIGVRIRGGIWVLPLLNSYLQLNQFIQLIGLMLKSPLDLRLFSPTTKEITMSLINTAVQPFKTEAFHNGKFIAVSDESLKGKWSVLIFMPAAFTFNCPTEVEDAADNYA